MTKYQFNSQPSFEQKISGEKNYISLEKKNHFQLLFVYGWARVARVRT
jgi:hypothetical protein